MLVLMNVLTTSYFSFLVLVSVHGFGETLHLFCFAGLKLLQFAPLVGDFSRYLAWYI